MRTLLSRLWHDDSGAALSVELILIIAILVFGVIPGLVAMRNSLNAFLASMANLWAVLTPAFLTTTVNVNGSTQTAIVVYPGGANASQGVAQQVAPIDVGPVSISPAP
jgi:Flp pilus assembly pilin Flp